MRKMILHSNKIIDLDLIESIEITDLCTIKKMWVVKAIIKMKTGEVLTDGYTSENAEIKGVTYTKSRSIIGLI